MDQVTKSSRQLVGERTICPPDAPPDLLSEVLHDLRLARATYGRSELTAPWGIKIPFKEGVRFHFLAEGSCWMYTDSQPSMFLDTGDVVLLPRGTGHVIADKPTRRARPLEDIGPELIGNAVYRLSAGGGGERTLIVCCTIGFEGPTAHPLIELLPEVMHVRQSDFSDPALPALLTMMADEVLQPQIGSATIMARLADIVMTRIIRAWVETRPSDLTGWLAAVKDPNVGLALARIHRHPGQDWNVESLASIAGMSRSKFSERFSHLLGVSPAKYLSQWRMRLAATWLRNEYMTVAQTAEQFGYESDAAFSRAFKRFWGVPPSASRNTTP
ncbi:MAG: AraC family transcriptional regulator [Mesorhizobium sp.]|nr:MAG: AraC family transcriptional regulator [Mesorhizobium sp.]RWJ12043.1 MAG: AraC family transcriptional regulator [Mesorhizobium sp.]